MDEVQFQDDDDREDYGIEAIIYLQGISGIVETVEEARAGWRSMDEIQQAITLDMYSMAKRFRESNPSGGVEIVS